MAISDTKKCQTMINICGQQIQIIRSAIATMLAVRAAFQTINPDTTGTPLEGNVAFVNQAIVDLDDSVNAGTNNTVWNQMEAAIVPSHRNAALEG